MYQFLVTCCLLASLLGYSGLDSEGNFQTSEQPLSVAISY